MSCSMFKVICFYLQLTYFYDNTVARFVVDWRRVRLHVLDSSRSIEESACV